MHLLTSIFGRDIMVPHHGLVAQLGERTVRIRKVEGSIPFESTNRKATHYGWFFLLVRYLRKGDRKPALGDKAAITAAISWLLLVSFYDMIKKKEAKL